MKKLVETASAIFDEYRLQIIKLLQIREMCVCELAAILNLSSSRISQHLAVMRRAKLVKERREGKWIYYSLVPKTVSEFTASWNQFLDADPDSLTGMRSAVKRLRKMDLTDVKQRCAYGEVRVTASVNARTHVSNINQQQKEGTNDGN